MCIRSGACAPALEGGAQQHTIFRCIRNISKSLLSPQTMSSAGHSCRGGEQSWTPAWKTSLSESLYDSHQGKGLTAIYLPSKQPRKKCKQLKFFSLWVLISGERDKL